MMKTNKTMQNTFRILPPTLKLTRFFSPSQHFKIYKPQNIN